MSSMKCGRSQLGQGKRAARPKKTEKRREWVSTVSDLSVHKASPAELSHRHELHKSHNTAVAQWEMKERSLRRCHKHLGSPAAPMDQASLSIIREVFSDQLLLQDVLARSDRAMAVVKDLFGDAPRRHTGHPSVTMAPDCDSDSELPVVQRADPPTQLSLLSHSTMNQQALNELGVSEEDCSEEEETRGPTAVAGANSPRRANLRKMKTTTKTPVGRGPQRPRAKPSSSHRGLGGGAQVTPCAPGRAPDPAALNATLAVQRVRTRTSQSEGGLEAEPDVQDSRVSHASGRAVATPCRQTKTRRHPETSGPLDGSSVLSLGRNQSSLDLLQAMLAQVEADLDSLGPQEPEREGQGEEPAEQPARTQGLTGFSVALVSTLGRLVHLLRQREEEAQREARERSRLEEEVRDQRALIDALSAESLSLREESAALQAGLQQRAWELEQRLDTVVLALGGVDLLGPLDDSHTAQDHQGLTHSPISEYRSPLPQAEYHPRATQYPLPPAVLLSPPQQRDNQSSLGGPPVATPSDVRRSHNSTPGALYTRSSATPVTPDPEGQHPLSSEEAIVAEIVRLSQQNERIKAQLSQTRALGSVLSRSPAASTAESTPSSSSTVSQMTGTSRPVPVCPPEAAELNKQCVAARQRLLELIEQQKQIASPVSPSISPIPPSAFSPTPADGRTPESSVSLPDLERSQGSGGSRRPTNPGAQMGDASRPKANKQREGEGWFALSSHVR